MKRLYLISILLVTMLLFYTCKLNDDDENITIPTTTITTTTTTNFLDGKDGYPALSSSTGCHITYIIGVSTTSLNDCTGTKGIEATTKTYLPNSMYQMTAYFGQIIFVMLIDNLNIGSHTIQYSSSICNNFTVYFGTAGFFSTYLANALGYSNNFNITVDKVENGFVKGSFSGRALTDDLSGYTDITNGKFTAKIE